MRTFISSVTSWSESRSSATWELPLWNLAWLMTSVVGGREVEIVFAQVFFVGLSFIRRLGDARWWLSLLAPFLLTASRFPEVANHENLGLGLALFALCAGVMTGSPRRSLFLFARAGLFFLYFWAALHKLNTDFIDPSVSCANSFLEDFFGRPFPSRLLPWGVILLEASLAALLALPRWRKIAFLVALGFHGALIFFGFANFAVWIATIFWLAFPRELRSWEARGFCIIYPVLALLAIWQAFSFSRSLINFNVLLNLTVLVLLLIVFCGLFFYARQERPSSPVRHRLVVRVLVGAWVGGLIFWGGMSYLGLRTAGNFSMFSNLATEGERWNHLLLPRSLKLFSYQDEIHWFTDVPPEARALRRSHPRSRSGSPDLEVARLKQHDGWTQAAPQREYSRWEFLLVSLRVIPGRGESQRCLW